MTDVQIVKGVRPTKKIPNFSLPKMQTPESELWCLVVDKEVASVLHVVLSDDYLLFNYAYTYPEFRRRGYSRLLRGSAVRYAKVIGKAQVVSVPLPGANSEGLLKKMGFQRADGMYYLNLTYRLD